MASKKSRLEAAAAEATKIFFSGADAGEPEGVSEAAQTETTTKTTRSKSKAVEPVRRAIKTSEAVIFSVRADADAVAEWKAYAKAKTGASMASVVDAAMTEYMKRHKLTEAEMGIYDFELKKADFLKHYKP